MSLSTIPSVNVDININNIHFIIKYCRKETTQENKEKSEAKNKDRKGKISSFSSARFSHEIDILCLLHSFEKFAARNRV